MSEAARGIHAKRREANRLPGPYSFPTSTTSRHRLMSNRNQFGRVGLLTPNEELTIQIPVHQSPTSSKISSQASSPNISDIQQVVEEQGDSSSLQLQQPASEDRAQSDESISLIGNAVGGYRYIHPHNPLLCPFHSIPQFVPGDNRHGGEEEGREPPTNHLLQTGLPPQVYEDHKLCFPVDFANPLLYTHPYRNILFTETAATTYHGLLRDIKRTNLVQYARAGHYGRPELCKKFCDAITQARERIADCYVANLYSRNTRSPSPRKFHAQKKTSIDLACYYATASNVKFRQYTHDLSLFYAEEEEERKLPEPLTSIENLASHSVDNEWYGVVLDPHHGLTGVVLAFQTLVLTLDPTTKTFFKNGE